MDKIPYRALSGDGAELGSGAGECDEHSLRHGVPGITRGPSEIGPVARRVAVFSGGRDVPSRRRATVRGSVQHSTALPKGAAKHLSH